MTVTKMYGQSLSTRKVSTICEKMCGVETLSTQVSRAAQQMNEALEAWRIRPLEVWPKSSQKSGDIIK
ncbi:MAG: transposase [Anaerolineaceae bacterium]|nr:transposase [Anaerolineaceae bacterium]